MSKKQQQHVLVISNNDDEGNNGNACSEAVAFTGFPVFTETFGWVDSQKDLYNLCKVWEYTSSIECINKPNTPKIQTYTRKIKDLLKDCIVQSCQSKVWNPKTQQNDREVVSTFVYNSGLVEDEEGLSWTLDTAEFDWDIGSGETDVGGGEILKPFEDEIIKIGKEVK